MRYQSLHLISLFYKLAGIIGAIVVMILFVVFEAGAINLVNIIIQAQGIQASLTAYVAATLPPFYFLIAGLLSCLMSYGFGAFLTLMIDIEQGIRNLDYRSQRAELPKEDAPLAPRRPLASFPPSQYDRPRRKAGEDRPRPQGKWDTGE